MRLTQIFIRQGHGEGEVATVIMGGASRRIRMSLSAGVWRVASSLVITNVGCQRSRGSTPEDVLNHDSAVAAIRTRSRIAEPRASAVQISPPTGLRTVCVAPASGLSGVVAGGIMM